MTTTIRRAVLAAAMLWLCVGALGAAVIVSPGSSVSPSGLDTAADYTTTGNWTNSGTWKFTGDLLVNGGLTVPYLTVTDPLTNAILDSPTLLGTTTNKTLTLYTYETVSIDPGDGLIGAYDFSNFYTNPGYDSSGALELMDIKAEQTIQVNTFGSSSSLRVTDQNGLGCITSVSVDSYGAFRSFRPNAYGGYPSFFITGLACVGDTTTDALFLYGGFAEEAPSPFAIRGPIGGIAGGLPINLFMPSNVPATNDTARGAFLLVKNYPNAESLDSLHSGDLKSEWIRGGITTNFAVLIPGSTTNWMQFSYGILTNISTTAP